MGGLPTQRIVDLAAAGGQLKLAGLRGSAPAWAIARFARERRAPSLLVTPDDGSARRARAEIRFHLAQLDEAGAADVPVALYPLWDSPPFKGYSPSASITRRRIAALHLMGRRAAAVVVAPAAGLLKRVLAPGVLGGATERLAVGDEIDRDALVRRLALRGYLATDLASEPGTFAVRGGILDVWGPSQPAPLRVEFWGDEVESIRAFDPWTQRSTGTQDAAAVLPAREEWLDDESLRTLPVALKRLCDARGLPPRARIELARELTDGALLQELELYLPLLQPDLTAPAAHLAPGGLVIVDGPGAIEASLIGRAGALHAAWQSARGRERLLPEPDMLFAHEDDLVAELGAGRGLVVLPELQDLSDAADPVPTVEVQAPDHGDLRALILAKKESPDGMLAPLVDRVRSWLTDGADVRVVGSRKQGAQLAALLDRYDLALPFVVGDVTQGFRALGDGVVWVAADEVLGARKEAAHKGPKRTVGHEAIGSLAQLNKGELVVHAVHGIGRFEGLSKLRLDASALEVAAEQRARAADPGYVPGSKGPASSSVVRSNNDYLLVTYKGGDRLYLPVHKLDLLARYVSAGGPSPRLDKLGGQTWSKRRKKVAEEVQKVARELLELYARRSVARAHAFAPTLDDEMFIDFAAGFPFEETPDQQAAIDAVLGDMGKPQPMDRLVVGDVGFGKTEVALRATFAAVLEGKQVAVLVPTTILALQHFEAFRERLESTGASIEMMSRFRTAATQRETVRKLKEGRLDVVVGTHALLGKRVEFADLGLLIVDEEHRFGVRHKERIKELRAGVDVLTLTATPIPRTLHMALSGLRDFSIITTAPEGRRAVRTSVAKFGTRRVHDAIRFELDRGGQVFFVHNRVQTIHKMADLIRKMLPEARVRVGHGQMAEKELEDIMLSFFRRDFDVLVCTTIVESGIDVPSANTIIINRADRLGLAQLHQLRGRVGRSMEQAFCLLLVPPGRALRRIALDRLKVIQDHSDLGSGHRIAQHDMELRGAGNLLGRKQSGHIADVGLVTYLELLEGAVRKLKGQEAVTGFDPEVDLKADAWIPADYVPDERDRLTEYKRLCDARSTDELEGLLEELSDRYGRPPPEVLAFEHLIEVKVRARDLRVLSVRMVRGGRLQLTFDPSTPIDPVALMARVARQTRRMTFKPEGVLLVSLDEHQRKAPVDAAIAELSALADCVVRDPGMDPTPTAC